MNDHLMSIFQNNLKGLKMCMKRWIPKKTRFDTIEDPKI